MTNKVIIGSAHHWKSPIQISAHQLAKQFSRHGWKVGFVSNPISVIHLMRFQDPIIRSQLANWRKGGEYDEDRQLFHYCPLTLMPLLAQTAQYKWIVQWWNTLALPDPVSILKQQDFSVVDLLVLDSPLQAYLLDAIPAKKTVFRITDYNPGFMSTTSTLTSLESQLVKRVDCVVITAEKLRPYAESLRAKQILHISNGVDLSHFTSQQHAMPVEFESIPSPRAIYIGSMAEWFDYELLMAAAKALPEVSFVLIGPDRMARKKLSDLPNIHILGVRPYNTIPAYLQHSDVGLIPFDAVNHASLVEAINPIKLYEYFASGLPVVATDWAELRSLKSPAVLCKNADTFIQRLKEIIKNGKQEGNEMRKYVETVDWKNRFADFINAIGIEMTCSM